MTNCDLPRWMTPRQYAECMQLNVVHVRRMCEAGRIPACKATGRWRIDRDKALGIEGGVATEKMDVSELLRDVKKWLADGELLVKRMEVEIG